ncbi:hypothetical protein VTI74DRAFT_3800 [Chaetomium olivicolor]
MFGLEHATAALEAPTQATSKSCDLRLLATWNVSAVADKENGFDIVTGCWKSTCGDEGHSPIDASEEDLWGQILVFHAFNLHLVRGVLNAKQWKEIQQKVFQDDVVEEDNWEPGHELVIEFREDTEDIRKRHVNASITTAMETGDAPASPDDQEKVYPV